MGATSRVTMHNRYAGKCETCGSSVEAGAGLVRKVDGRWLTRHEDCGATPNGPVASETPSAGFAPTPEQQAALTLFGKGESMVIEAGAGTGKTSTLRLLAASTSRRCQYIAFNKAIVVEAAEKFPSNVSCSTAHSLAFRAVGKRFKHRLNAPRMRSDALAQILRVSPITIRFGQQRKVLSAGYLAGYVMRAVGIFCQTADAEPTRRHMPYIDGIDLPDPRNGARTFANNDEVAAAMLPAVRRAWADLCSEQGQLPYRHDHYLKLWQLSNPRINADFILFDEAQDANPVMAAIVAAQTHAQVVYVGDSQQAIYEFTGAVNTLQKLGSDHRCFLTQSFRFGSAIADTANVVLERLGAELRLVGTPSIRSTVGLLEREDAILCRTNAHAVETMLQLQQQGRRPHLVGGGTEVVAFAKAARDLQDDGFTSHPELACFDSWAAVQDYVENDQQGSELRLLVKLVDDFGVETILQALEFMPNEHGADVVVSTAHKAKGREWDRVRLGSDFPVEDDDASTPEMRLLYVAVTRAKLQLDMSSVSAFFADDEDVEPAPADVVPALDPRDVVPEVLRRDG